MNSRKHPYFARSKRIVLYIAIFFFSTGLAYTCPSPTTSFPIVDDFESNAFANWTQGIGDDFDWIVKTGATSSGSTGPSGAFDGTYYAYTEATTPNNPSKVANLMSPCFSVQTDMTTQISFAYHMYGAGMGSFNVDVSTDDGVSWVNLWGLSGDQGDNWLMQTISLDAYIGQAVKVRFNVVTGTYQSDVSIDNVVISTSSTVEICDDNMDNDGDGLTDEYDPDCGVVCYNDCATPYLFNWKNSSGGGNSWEITNGQNSLTRVYTISGAQGDYNVSVTLDNPDSQNIDFSNCGTAGNHFYTATCNDPNATANCDGDPGVADGQFSYGCDFLTFGITSDNSNQTTSITYDFQFPSQICNLQIGDIDYQGSGSAALESWQDEIDVVASNNGTPVAINAIVGSKVNVLNNNTPALNLLADYGGGTGGNITPDDADGHATITTLDKVTSITFTYSNGPDDEGQSDDHAIRINGFEFCPQEKGEICDNGIDDDEDGLIDCEDVDCGMLDNIEFKDGTANWNHFNLFGNTSTFTIDNSGELSGNNSAKIEITNVGTSAFNTVFEQNNASIESGKTYRVHFNAKSDISRDIEVLVQKTASPFTTYFSQVVPIANFNGTYVYEFTANATDNNVDLSFFLGQAESTVWLDKIQLKEVCPDPECILPTDDSYNICDGENLSNTVAGNDQVATETFNTSYEISTPPTKGNIVIEDDGSFIYTPNANTIGTDQFTYERCYSFKNSLGLNNVIFNPCGDGKIIETFIEGIEGESSPSIAITSPNDFTTLIVEVWAESACSSVTIEGQAATEYDIFRTDGTKDTEKIYRVELTSVSGDGLINISSGGGCTLSSAAAYVERVQANGQGSSTLLESDIDLYEAYVSDDDCFVYNMPIGTSDNARDITFTIPLHEKDNFRVVNANVIAGSIIGTGTSSSWSSIGQGAGEITITLSNVPGNVDVASIEVCSPDNNGDSFGVGFISATSLICSGEPSFDCCAEATATIEIVGASVSNSDETICTGESSVLIASDNSTGSNSTYAWSHSSETTAQVEVSPLVTTTYVVTVTSDLGCMNTAETTVTVLESPIADAGADISICSSDSITLGGGLDFSSVNNGFLFKATNESAAADYIKFTKNGNFGPRLKVYTSDQVNPITISASKRARIESGNPSKNHNDPRVGYDGNKYDRSLIQFDLNSITGTVTQAELILKSTTNGNLGVSVYPIDETWEQTEATRNERAQGIPWKTPGIYKSGDYLLDDQTLTSVQDYSWDVTEAVAKWVNQYEWSNGETTEKITVLPTVTTTYTLTVTAPNGCTDTDEVTITVEEGASADISGPSIICFGNAAILTSTVSGGMGTCGYQWEESTDNANWSPIAGATGSTLSIVGQVTNTYYRLKYSCSGNVICPVAYSDVHLLEINPDLSVDIDYSGTLCLEDDTQLTAVVTGGTPNYQYSWTGPNLFTANTQVIDIAVSGNYYVTVTDASGCTAEFAAFVYESYQPFIFTLNTEVCEGESVTLSVNSGSAVQFNWGANAGNATTSSVTVTPSPPSTDYTVTVTNDQGCTVEATATIDVIVRPVVSVTGPSPICVGETTNLSPSTGGNWVSTNNAVATVTSSGLVSGVSAGNVSFIFTNGNTQCESLPTTPISVLEKSTVSVTGPTSICEGFTTQLSPTSGGTWSSNDTNIATVTNGGVVTGVGEGSTTFIFTNSTTGCASDATIPVTIKDRPIAEVTGGTILCIGSTTTLSPTSGGTWASSNSSVLIVSNGGVVTALNEGTATFIFTTSEGCVSDPTEVISVISSAIVNVDGESIICEGESTTLTATGASNFQWSTGEITESISVSPIVNTTYTVTGYNTVSGNENIVRDEIGFSNSDFTYINSTNSWAGAANLFNDIDNTGGATFHASRSTNGQTWGISYDLGDGYFISDVGFDQRNDCCTNRVRGGVVQVYNDGVLVYTSNTVTGGGNGILNASPTPNVVGDEVRYVFLNGINNEANNGTLNFSEWIIEGQAICEVTEDFVVNINSNPVVNVVGPATVCVGEITQLSTSGSGGFWTSSDSDIAIVSSTGVVAGISGGSVSFTYTSSNGCESSATGIITVDPAVEVEVDFNGSLCLTDDSQLSAIVTGGTPGGSGFTYSWTGPGGFSGSTQTIDIFENGNYNLTVTDSKGCSSNTTAFVYELYEPFIFALNTEVCEGEEVTLSVNSTSSATYLWGANAGNSTEQSVTVTPGVPNTSYNVTVTNSLGCSTVATAVIDVDAKPVVNITGANSICENGTTQLSPSTGGIWTSSDYSVATVNNTGLVTGVSSGTVRFTYRSDATGCYSEPSSPVTVTSNGTITISGDNQICIGENPTLTASETGGTWSSSNIAVAQISNSGVITPNSQGSAVITYTPSLGECYFDGNYEINVHSTPILTVNGPSTICENDQTYLGASTSGAWTSSDPTIATVSSIGVVTGLSAGTVTFSFVSSAGCPQTLGTPITIIGNPKISLNGPGDICINSTTSLLPNSGGIWISSNTGVATVSSSGIVTGVSPGIAMFTFIEYSYGCTSENMISINVSDDPTINGLDDDNLCIGETTTITPSTGGTWTSSNTSVASINNSGLITAIGSGSATFVYTNTLTGCSSKTSMPLTVNSNPTINFNGPTSICSGETTSISPSTGGTWASTNVSIATITSEGVITGVAPGTVRFIFTNSTTGCTSDESELLTIEDPTKIEISGPSNICMGETTSLSPSTGGVWESSNNNIATITNNGIVTGIAPGSVTFIFNSTTGCSSDPSTVITIDPTPNTSFTGPSAICIGTTTTLTPTSGGTWTSSNSSVATVNNSGLVTGVSAGSAMFTFVDSNTGCSTTEETFLNVFGIPVVSIAGEDQICIGNTTNMLPSTGGTWVSSDNSIASISSSGVVTGLNAGMVTFTYYETGTGCVSNASNPITILPKPVVNITGSNVICEGEITTLSPSSGGSWSSNNEGVATVTNQGVVTGITQGLARFTFISNDGCPSNETSPIIVYGKPTIVLDSPNLLCLGETGQMLPSSGGIWTSNNPSVATINNSGLFTSISAGTVMFTFMDNATGCTSAESDEVTVNEQPTISTLGPSSICIGGSTNMVPTDGGVWVSLNPSIATVQNNGEVVGVSAGSARFLFTNVNTGCTSDTSAYITVEAGPTISFTGPQDICIGETSNISPSSGGTWVSTNNNIAIIDNNGLITAIGQGSVRFRYTDSATGCSSGLSATLTVNGAPSVSVSGPTEICIGGSTTLSPSTGGTWTSLQTGIATVDQFGNVTGVSNGTANFVFVDAATGCESDGTLSVIIQEGIDVGITGDAQICLGYSTTLSPSSGGFWTSSNPAIASVSNSGIVTGRAPGVVTFEFTDGTTGCTASGPTDPITVELCTNHDFNVTLANLEIQGNVNTNDNVPAGTTYSNSTVTMEKPLASLPALTINSDGTYTFVTNRAGKYIYSIPVCVPPLVNGCPTTYLEINVIDNIYSESNPVGNLEFATTFTHTDPLQNGIPIVIDAGSNDACVNIDGCILDMTSLTVHGGANHGVTSVNAQGEITYVPQPGFIGKDTLYYSMCEDGSLLNCSNSLQVITVNDVSALNSTVAADDFTFTFKETPISGNVRDNDSDPEGDGISVLALGSASTPMSMTHGEYYIEADGDFTFIPAEGFVGSTEIIYTLCDDAPEPACTQATIHILVFDDISINLRVYLEGALMLNGGQTSSFSGLPLMRDDLRVSPFTGQNYIPGTDPYTYMRDPFMNTPSMFTKLGPGMMSKNTIITDSTAVFAVTGDNAIVDWVHVELRSKDDYTIPIATRSALVQRDGDVVDLDGVSSLRFDGISADSFYVVVKHRSHLGVMSMKVEYDQMIDFTDPNFPTFNFGTNKDITNDYTGLSQKSNVVSGYMALWAGDFDSNGQVKFTNPRDDVNILFLDVLFSSPGFLINYNSAVGYYTGDYNMNSKAKYTNPDDDINFLFSQVLLYPLNTGFLSNFNALIEQIPE